MFVAVALVAIVLAPRFPFARMQPLHVALACSLLLASAMVPNSAEAVVAVVNECRARGKLSEMVLAVTVIKDIAAVLIFVIALSLAEVLISGRGGMELGMLAAIVWEISGSLAAGAALGWLLGLYIETLGAELPAVVVGLGFSASISRPACACRGS